MGNKENSNIDDNIIQLNITTIHYSKAPNIHNIYQFATASYNITSIHNHFFI